MLNAIRHKLTDLLALQLAELNALVTEGIKTGEVKPLPITVYSRAETEEAFRYMAAGTPLNTSPDFA